MMIIKSEQIFKEIRNISLSIPVLFLIVILSLGLCACAGKTNTSLRGMSKKEIDEFDAKKAARQKFDEQQANVISDPKQVEAHGDRLASQGIFLAALFEYNRALQLAKPDQHYHLRTKIATTNLHNKHFAQAEQVFTVLSKKDPVNAFIWEGLGFSLFFQGKYDEAEKALRKAVRLGSKRWKSLNALGVIYNKKKKSVTALQFFDQALKLNPTEPSIHNNCGLALMQTDDLGGAERSFQRALGLAPDYHRARNNLGLLYARQDRWSEALLFFETGLGTAIAQNNIGCLLARKGDYIKAGEHFRKAVETAPSYYSLAAKHLDLVQNEIRKIQWAPEK